MLRDVTNVQQRTPIRVASFSFCSTPDSVLREETAIRERLRAELAEVEATIGSVVEVTQAGGNHTKADSDGETTAAAKADELPVAASPQAAAADTCELTIGQAVERIRIELGFEPGIPSRRLVDMAKRELGWELGIHGGFIVDAPCK